MDVKHANARERREEEEDQYFRGWESVQDIKFIRTPHNASSPSPSLIDEIQRILGRSDPPVIDFEHTPSEPTSLPMNDPFIPGKTIYRSLMTTSSAVYTVRRVTGHELCACASKLFALRGDASRDASYWDAMRHGMIAKARRRRERRVKSAREIATWAKEIERLRAMQESDDECDADATSEGGE